ncbi:hypothetical protein QUF54_02955 [Candidatus Marithioploca araucensis]|uniref:Uncharacterized protein n=1 Tax=Candidatus Marithioploca araucensis TaxID=70273 RepID=A0ABT7VSN3_9GAMM|nr:hypothetical protein [Candidatus Marithioploca araucensis]
MLERLFLKMLLNSGIILLLAFSNVLYARDIVLPSLTTDFYIEASQPNVTLLRKEYRESSLPQAFGIGELVRIKVLIPPGASKMSMGGTSNFWYGNGPGKQLVFEVFGEDPGNKICAEGETTACISLNDLKPYTGAFVLTQERSETSFEKDQPFFAHLVFYNPNTSKLFNFVSLNMTIVVTDSHAYNTWRAKRPWAGGTSPSNDGVGETLGVVVKPDPPEDDCTKAGSDSPCYSLSSETLHIPKVIIDGNDSVSFCDIEMTSFTTPTGLQFTLSKGSPCQ